MSSTIRRLLALLFVLLAGCASRGPAQREAQRASEPVILISIDGFCADYLDRGLTPTLASLAATGVRADALKPAKITV